MKKVYFIGEYIPIIYEIFRERGYVISNREEAELLFSINYDASIAEYCFQNSKKYASWVVDSPHTVLYSKTFHYPTNFIFLFDYMQFCTMKARSTTANIFYLPLASDSAMFGQALGKSNGEKYKIDVSFLGRLYRDADHTLFDRIQYLPTYVKGYMDSLFNIQQKLWGVNIFKEAISNSVWEQLREHVKWEIEEDYDEHYEETMIGILQQKVAQIERMKLCSLLAQNFNFTLYSPDSTEFDKNIVNRGAVDYLKEMPFVFANSKININLTLRSIETGIPLRCLDIMACGGFLMTNFQEEIMEYFEDGKELVIYQDFEDMIEKIRYYLHHEEERKEIARCGYEKVKKEFSYEKQLGFLIDVLEKE